MAGKEECRQTTIVTCSNETKLSTEKIWLRRQSDAKQPLLHVKMKRNLALKQQGSDGRVVPHNHYNMLK